MVHLYPQVGYRHTNTLVSARILSKPLPTLANPTSHHESNQGVISHNQGVPHTDHTPTPWSSAAHPHTGWQVDSLVGFMLSRCHIQWSSGCTIIGPGEMSCNPVLNDRMDFSQHAQPHRYELTHTLDTHVHPVYPVLYSFSEISHSPF
jgi:hypothetical protein